MFWAAEADLAALVSTDETAAYWRARYSVALL